MQQSCRDTITSSIKSRLGKRSLTAVLYHAYPPPRCPFPLECLRLILDHTQLPTLVKFVLSAPLDHPCPHPPCVRFGMASHHWQANFESLLTKLDFGYKRIEQAARDEEKKVASWVKRLTTKELAHLDTIAFTTNAVSLAAIEQLFRTQALRKRIGSKIRHFTIEEGLSRVPADTWEFLVYARSLEKLSITLDRHNCFPSNLRLISPNLTVFKFKSKSTNFDIAFDLFSQLPLVAPNLTKLHIDIARTKNGSPTTPLPAYFMVRTVSSPYRPAELKRAEKPSQPHFGQPCSPPVWNNRRQSHMGTKSNNFANNVACTIANQSHSHHRCDEFKERLPRPRLSRSSSHRN